MPIDERTDLDRLSRGQLYKEADAWGVSYPQDAPKFVMVPLLAAMGVNRNNTKTVRWQTIYPSDDERAAAAHQGVATSEQSYPVREIHQSARDGVDTSAILQERLAKADAKNEEKEDEIDALKKANEALMKRLEALEQKPKRKLNKRAQLLQEAKAKGIKTSLKMTTAEVEALLNDHAG